MNLKICNEACQLCGLTDQQLLDRLSQNVTGRAAMTRLHMRGKIPDHLVVDFIVYGNHEFANLMAHAMDLGVTFEAKSNRVPRKEAH